ncbi:MAG: hypothetical protein QHH30_11655, partial [candidate division NC10 bacterium]|nr:hypothetical protein [candidate division NC10 bacterium]
VEPEDPAQLCEAILRLKDDPSLRQEFGRKGREFVIRNFNRKDLAGRLEKVLREVTGDDRPPSETQEGKQTQQGRVK